MDYSDAVRHRVFLTARGGKPVLCAKLNFVYSKY